MEIISSLNISLFEWSLIMICGMLVGMSKVGVPGVTMIIVPAMAFIFGAKQSTGVLFPILMMADIFIVAYYHRHASWTHLIKYLQKASGHLNAAEPPDICSKNICNITQKVQRTVTFKPTLNVIKEFKDLFIFPFFFYQRIAIFNPKDFMEIRLNVGVCHGVVI
jgi:hypothetical protein